MVKSSRYVSFALVALVSFSQAELPSRSYIEENTGPLERRLSGDEYPATSPTRSSFPSTFPSVTTNPSSSPSDFQRCDPSPTPIIDPLSYSVCQDFAVHARTTVTFDGVKSIIHSGDVSVSPGTSITGDYQLNDGKLVDDSSAFAASVLAAYDAAMTPRYDGKPMAIEMGGKTFTPGTYRSGSAINFAYGTMVTLDGLNEPNPVFLFQAGTTLVTAAGTSFILKNGAQAENVLWALGSAATLGADSVLEGSILAGTAITFGTQSELRGCALAQSAVTFESEGSVVKQQYSGAEDKAGTGSAMCTKSCATNLAPTFHDVCQNFAVHARTAVTFAGVQSTIHHGDVGVSPGTSITGNYASGGGALVADSADFAASVLTAYSAAFVAGGPAMAVEMGGKTFTPGTYRSGTISIAVGTVVTLDGLNKPYPEFLFQAGTTLITAANTNFNLINGAKAENVRWVLGTAATLGANSVLEGSILAGTAITFGTKSELHGCALAQSAVTFESEGSIKGRTGSTNCTESCEICTESCEICTEFSSAIPSMSVGPSQSPSDLSALPASTFEPFSHSVCQNYAVHARTTVTFAGLNSNIHKGDVGVSPGTSITGPYLIDNGVVLYDSANFAASVLTAYDAAVIQRYNEKVIAIEIGGKTFTPGTHRSGSAINFAYGTVVTLDGLNEPNPEFLFQAGTTLTTAAGTYFILKNGAKAENVRWVLGTAATLGANSVLEGSILAGTAITFGTDSKLHGCALAKSSVTFESQGTVYGTHYSGRLIGRAHSELE